MAAEKCLHEMTTEELGELFPVILQPYDPMWADLYTSEKESIASLFQPPEVISIEHIGSTAIPGILPKKHKNNREAYIKAKHDFIEKIKSMARSDVRYDIVELSQRPDLV